MRKFPLIFFSASQSKPETLCKSHRPNLQTITHAAILHKIIYQSINLILFHINCHIQSESRKMISASYPFIQILFLYLMILCLCATANWRDSHKELNTKRKEAGKKMLFQMTKNFYFLFPEQQKIIKKLS